MKQQVSYKPFSFAVYVGTAMALMLGCAAVFPKSLVSSKSILGNLLLFLLIYIVALIPPWIYFRVQHTPARWQRYYLLTLIGKIYSFSVFLVLAISLFEYLDVEQLLVKCLLFLLLALPYAILVTKMEMIAERRFRPSEE